MRIGIFVATAGRNAGGPETYEVGLLRALAKIDRDNEYIVYCFNEAAERAVGVHQENFKYHHLWMGNVRPISMMTSLPWEIKRAGLDYVHATFIPPPICPQEYIYTLLCFSPFQYPEHYPAAVRLRIRALCERGVQKSTLTICISQSIKDSTAELFKLPLERFMVTHLAASDIFKPWPHDEMQDVLRNRYGIRDPYILFSGRWEPRKNILGTIEAFARVKKENPSNLKLVLTGKRTWSAREADELIARHGIQSEVIDLGKSPLEELPALYGGAQALVFASFWEGFGFPIVEAMACGTPVITSNVSSMPEVAGDAALLVDPHSIDEIAAAIHNITNQPRLREELKVKGLARAQQFSWETTARQTLAAYQQMAAAN
jgi:glycosyltransferase involved in cell wall biosynthesis